ncbi:MAG TPA: CaiB/BaiF CoA-transferase family protein [Syntrophales bacterium]|nr:CaiB/BaiF CoA-transferase family protein [Syntrophales bacterium]HOM06714.1 CaiB/BaiF CoA-transferase family protein [Syntrophales bacterium]HPQ06128.1 CaiB/BaiF CoA-transferase family protein [Syntrophales bacterium]HRV43550.1 CaiB/BaiF CoA-transferase family protein [Syntrophales bacterium]
MAGPLSGLKVLDFTTLLPGPYATMCLADMGAEVLRIVSPTRPDLVDFLPPKIPGTEVGAVSAWLGRGKRSMALDLKDPRGVAVVHRLLATYDVVVEQFRPGVMAKLGLDYESLKKVNPAVIYCAITGYGQTGPLRDRAGHDINYLSQAGVMAYSGRKDTGPVLTGMQIADVASGSNHAVMGVLAAVIHRMRTGQGQMVDISMTDGVMAFNGMVGAAFLVDGKEPGREGNWLNGGSLYDFYETKDGGYVSVGSLEPQFFSAFCRTLGREDLIAETVRPRDLERVKEEIRAIFRSRTRDEWIALFKEADCCVEPVLSLSEALEGENAKAREMVVSVPLPGGGTVRQLGLPIRFSATPPTYPFAAVPTGAHTREVLLEIGYTPEEIDDLAAGGLFGKTEKCT